MEKEPRSATVVALAPTRVMVTREDNFGEILSSDHQLSLKTMRSLSARIRKLNLALSIPEGYCFSREDRGNLWLSLSWLYQDRRQLNEE